jgi:hypothetical protein
MELYFFETTGGLVDLVGPGEREITIVLNDIVGAAYFYE